MGCSQCNQLFLALSAVLASWLFLASSTVIGFMYGTRLLISCSLLQQVFIDSGIS
jgi:hypothetical protein